MTTMTPVAAGVCTVDHSAHPGRVRGGPSVRTDGARHDRRDGRDDRSGSWTGSPRRFHATLDPASIDTGHARRDGDLRGRRFLAVDAYPTMEIVAERVEATVGGWRADATLRGHGCEAPLRIDATLDGAVTAPCLQVSGTARLDLRDVGIRVPGFLIRRFVDLSVSAQLTR